jgi:hypothetical protein
MIVIPGFKAEPGFFPPRPVQSALFYKIILLYQTYFAGTNYKITLKYLDFYCRDGKVLPAHVPCCVF